MNSVYALCDPRTSEIRYVGITNNLNRRFRFHIHSDNARNHKVSWVKSLKGIGMRPTMEVLEEFENESDCQVAERFWISYFKFLGIRLTNLSAGGHGCGSMSKEQKKKISDSLKKRLSDPKIREAHLSRFMSPEFREDSRLKQIVRSATPEWKRNQSRAQLLRFSKPEEKKKMSDGQLRRFRDPEQRAALKKMSGSPEVIFKRLLSLTRTIRSRKLNTAIEQINEHYKNKEEGIIQEFRNQADQSPREGVC